MTLPQPKVEEMTMRKASGEVSLEVPANDHISQIQNDLSIEYNIIKKDDETSNELKVSLSCDIHTEEGADPDTAGKLRANVEIVYQVVLNNTYTSDNISGDIDEIMQLVWPYLRLGAVHQLQLIDLSFVGDKLPYDVSREKPENVGTLE